MAKSEYVREEIRAGAEILFTIFMVAAILATLTLFIGIEVVQPYRQDSIYYYATVTHSDAVSVQVTKSSSRIEYRLAFVSDDGEISKVMSVPAETYSQLVSGDRILVTDTTSYRKMWFYEEQSHDYYIKKVETVTNGYLSV